MNTTLFKCGFKVPCDTYGCRSMAGWYVGREDGPLNSTFKLCDDCAKHLVNNLPDELKPKQKKVKLKSDEGQLTIDETGKTEVKLTEVKKASTKKSTTKKAK